MTLLQRVVLLSLLIMLSACVGEPAYTPDVTILATREAAEYERQVTRGITAWYIGVALMIAFSVILVILAWQLRAVGYRVQAAHAAKREAEARRLMLVDLGNGAVLDLGTNTIRATNHITAPQIAPIMRVEPLPPEPSQPTSLHVFILACVRINDGDWGSDIIPRYDRWSEIGETISSAEWMRLTDELVRLGLIVKQPNRRTEVMGDNDLRWVYDSLPPFPSAGTG